MIFSAEKVEFQVSRLSAAEPGGLCCLLDKATDRDGYGRILKVTWTQSDGTKVDRTEGATRIVYMLKIGVHSKYDFPVSTVSAVGHQAAAEFSHSCHNRLCVHPQHLSLEPKAVNLGRTHC